MVLRHFGQAGAIIKLCGVAEMHCEDLVRPCQQPQRVAFKGAISHSAACVCGNIVTWQSASVRPLRRLSLFIKLNISHETNEPDLS